MKTASELLESFIVQHGGKIPESKPNLTSTGSDIAFVFTSYYMCVLDLWHATADQRCIDMLIEATGWVFTQTDQCIKDNEYDVTDWTNGKKTVQKLRLSDEGYARSPRTQGEWSPGWSRWIYYDGQKLGFRPECLTDFFTSQAIASFTNDCSDLIPADKRAGWLEKLAEIVEFHSPSWKTKHVHSEGEIFGTPHKGMEVSAYFWPASNDGSGKVHNTAIAFNQISVSLTAGLLIENQLGRDIGAMKRAKEFCTDTLPKYLVEDDEGRAFHVYDFRRNPGELSADTYHAYKANIFLTHAYKAGLVKQELLTKIIRQVKDVCHIKHGRMYVLMHGSDDHAPGYDPNKHPSAGHWLECLLWPGGEVLIPIAEDTIALENRDKTDHKSMSFKARLARAIHERMTDPAKADKPHDMPMSNADPTPQDSIPWSPPADVKQPDKPALKKSEAQTVGQGESEKREEAKSGALPASDPARCDTTPRVRVGEWLKIPGTDDFDYESTANVKHHVTPNSAADITNTWPLMEVYGKKPCQALLTYVTKDGERKVEFEVID